jgi:hypothetical protein
MWLQHDVQEIRIQWPLLQIDQQRVMGRQWQSSAEGKWLNTHAKR